MPASLEHARARHTLWAQRAAALACVLCVTAGAAQAQTAVARAAPSPATAAVPAQPLTDAELAIAQQVHVGVLPCELGQTVRLHADTARPGYFHLHAGTHRFHVRPVISQTGAVRLEDRQQGAVWIQLANKSMLMHQRLGRRLADDCMSPAQQAKAEHLKHHPAPSLLDVAQVPRPR